MPHVMVWKDTSKDEYLGIYAFVQHMKNTIMAAHDSIIATRVKQTQNANQQCCVAPFLEGDLVYLFTKNISLPKGYSCKLTPKFIGPYHVLQDFSNSSFRLELPSNLKQRGVHNVFHASLLQVHEPNDDQLFPGCLIS